jgi:CRISPR system Cascade subunit CasB
VATLLGGTGGGDQPLLSEVRMRRLCEARDGATALRGFREAVLLLGRTAPILDLARSVIDWLDPERGDRRRTRWLFDYYSAGFAAPPMDKERTTENAS